MSIIWQLVPSLGNIPVGIIGIIMHYLPDYDIFMCRTLCKRILPIATKVLQLKTVPVPAIRLVEQENGEFIAKEIFRRIFRICRWCSSDVGVLNQFGYKHWAVYPDKGKNLCFCTITCQRLYQLSAECSIDFSS